MAAPEAVRSVLAEKGSMNDSDVVAEAWIVHLAGTRTIGGRFPGRASHVLRAMSLAFDEFVPERDDDLDVESDDDEAFAPKEALKKKAEEIVALAADKWRAKCRAER
jgi:hypothetical protein